MTMTSHSPTKFIRRLKTRTSNMTKPTELKSTIAMRVAEKKSGAITVIAARSQPDEEETTTEVEHVVKVNTHKKTSLKKFEKVDNDDDQQLIRRLNTRTSNMTRPSELKSSIATRVAKKEGVASFSGDFSRLKRKMLQSPMSLYLLVLVVCVVVECVYFQYKFC